MDNYVGKKLDGRYEMREIIGVGGMAVVYKAYDSIDDRIVSIKVLKDDFLANEEFRRRFKNESKAIAVMSHPNIVKVYDVSYGDKLQYIVMEYVEGITLKEYIEQQGKLSSREAVFFVIQVLRALQHAHDKGIVHRDIKPQNIMLLENGAIKVTDFGIARFSGSETKTLNDSTIGSVHYISPEQARGDVTDDKADIYSVGVMLYEMLTGKLPFESDSTVSVAIMQLQNDPELPRSINPEIPVGLEQIVVKAMQKNVNDRYQSAAEMLLDIEEFKRNPSVNFHYEYKNTEPTKYIPTVQTESGYVADDSDDYEPTPTKKVKTAPMIIGIVAGLLVVLGVAFALLYHFGYFTGVKEKKVPNFINKTYSAEEFAKEFPDFKFKIEETVDASKTPNTVIAQNPEAGERIDPAKTVITLTVSLNSEMVTVPSGLTGSEYTAVVSKLEIAGLQVKLKEVDAKEYSNDIEGGTVVAVSPSEGTMVSAKSVVTVEYISYDEGKQELVLVPNVSNLDENTAKQVLKSSGFNVTTSYSFSNTVKNGSVISNTLAGTKIPKGSAVTITVSRGVQVEQTVEITIDLPDKNNEPVQLVVTLDGTTIKSTPVNLNGDSYSFSVKGFEALSVVKVFLDANLYYKCNINFTNVSPKPTNEITYNIDETTTKGTSGIIPNVVGESESTAKTILRNAGFTNIYVETVSSTSVNAGEVVETSPSSGKTVNYDTAITLRVRASN